MWAPDFQGAAMMSRLQEHFVLGWWVIKLCGRTRLADRSHMHYRTLRLNIGSKWSLKKHHLIESAVVTLTGARCTCAAFDVLKNPRAPEIAHVVEPETIKEKTGLSWPHTSHCLGTGEVVIRCANTVLPLYTD